MPAADPLGARPRWSPRRFGDRALVALLGLAYLVFYAPMWLVHRLFGRARVDWVLLDLLSIPGAVFKALGALFGPRGRRWGLRANALEHTHLVCRLCPRSRQALRDPNGRGVCAWNRQWNDGNFDIAPNFGATNWLRQYRGRTDLSEFTELAGDGAEPLPPAEQRSGARMAASIALNAALVAAVLWVVRAGVS